MVGQLCRLRADVGRISLALALEFVVAVGSALGVVLESQAGGADLLRGPRRVLLRRVGSVAVGSSHADPGALDKRNLLCVLHL